MPELENLSIWMKGEDVDGGEMSAKISSPHKMVTITRQGKEELVPEIELTLSSGKGKRLWIPNNTARVELARMFGSNSDDWVGKEITLITKVKDVFGEDKLCIFVKPQGAKKGKKRRKK